MSGGIIHDLIGKSKFGKYHRYIEKYGGLAIFVFNLFPLASSVLALVSGMVRFKLKRFWFYSISGLFLKYLYLIFIFDRIFF